MKGQVKKAILDDLDQAIMVLESKGTKSAEELKHLSDHAIEDVALYKDLDSISITVLIYSLYKTIFCLDEIKYNEMLDLFKKARRYLKDNNYGAYNGTIKKMFEIVENCNAKVKEHLQDVMQAARIKKGTVLLQKGLSIGQAAGLMGLSNWDLQQYASKTPILFGHHEKIPAKDRLQKALKIFEVAS
jgi:hypothetical protein